MLGGWRRLDWPLAEVLDEIDFAGIADHWPELGNGPPSVLLLSRQAN